MFKKFFHKVKKLELNLPLVLGHDSTITDDTALKNDNNFDDNLNKSILDKITNFFFYKRDDSHLFVLTRRPLTIGVIVMILFFGVFGLWSVLAPIEGAVVASGQVISSSNRKVVQHLEGGVIEEILVKEGDKVKEGDVLVKLKDVSPKSQKIIIEDKLNHLKATEARLIAERDEKEQISFPPQLNLSKFIDNQERLFTSRKNNLLSQIGILNARIDQSNAEKEAMQSQLSSESKQIILVQEELENKKKLLASGNIDRPNVIALEKQLIVLEGKLAGDKAAIAKIEQQIGSTKLEILNVRNRLQNDVVTELKEVQSNIADVEEKLLTVSDVFNRTEIKAIASGIVTNLQYHTVSGVISPGAKIMEIIPADDDLIIEAHVAPNDIDAVLYAQNNNIITIDNITGSATKVRMLALNSRKVGLLQGVMTHVSADTIIDNRNPGMQYYLAQIRIPKSQLESVSRKKINLYPGMPVAVFIITEPRTLLSYLFSPISSTFDRAFRER